MALSIITCASGRLELFEKHLAALTNDPFASQCEYNCGVWGEPHGHLHTALKYDRFASSNILPVGADCWWPLPIAYNIALGMASGDRLLIVGSDVIVPVGLLEWAANRTEDDVAWCFSVNNYDGKEFVGPNRKVAIPYCITVPRQRVVDMGGWSHKFCNGTCFDDNDFAARLLIGGVTYRWCDKFLCVHQEHPRYGGAERAQRVEGNRQIWLQRLNGYDGPLWPIFWDDDNPPIVPPGDGLDEQLHLRHALMHHGYPRHGSYCVCQ